MHSVMTANHLGSVAMVLVENWSDRLRDLAPAK
jgi:hypothetical protein